MYGPTTPNSAVAHQTVTRALSRGLVKLLRVGFTPIAKDLLIYTAVQMKMCLVAANKDGISMNGWNVRAQLSAALPISVSEFLRYYQFVWMKLKVLMQNPLHRCVRRA